MSSIEKDKVPEDNRKRGRVKWYSERRGYGFIEVDGHEVFIHRTTLNQFGIIRIQNEDIVLITQVKTDRGFIVDTLYGVERPPLPDWLYATEKDEGEKLAEVKFFNEDKGYGFVMVEGHGQDIFIHSRTLEQNRLTGLDSGQRVLVRVADDGSGPVIDTIRFYVGTEEFDVEGDRPPIGNRSSEDSDEEEAMTVDESSGVRKKFYDLTSKQS